MASPGRLSHACPLGAPGSPAAGALCPPWLLSPFPGDAGLCTAGVGSAGRGQLSWSLRMAPRALLPPLMPSPLAQAASPFLAPVSSPPSVCSRTLPRGWREGCAGSFCDFLCQWAGPLCPGPLGLPPSRSPERSPVEPWWDLRPELLRAKSVSGWIVRPFSSASGVLPPHQTQALGTPGPGLSLCTSGLCELSSAR